MFGILGFLPAYILARILKALGMLRVPAQLEVAGLDLADEIRDETMAAIIKQSSSEVAKNMKLI